MVSLGFEPKTAGWKVLANPLSFGGPCHMLKMNHPDLFFVHYRSYKSKHYKFYNENM